MKLLNAQQIKACDAFTIQNEAITSLESMERAALACTRQIVKDANSETRFCFFCGMGNNGGDGLAIARHLFEQNYDVKIFVLKHTSNPSDDFQTNLKRLIDLNPTLISVIQNESELSELSLVDTDVIIDAVFGTGLNKTPEGFLKSIIKYMNASGKKIISIDVPSGLFCDSSNVEEDAVVEASLVLTFQFPKLSFLMPQNQKFVRAFKVLDIGLSKAFLDKEPSNYYFITKQDLKPFLKYRSKFSHKGNFGHALLLAGSKGKIGAALIAAKACLRSGAGMLTVHVPVSAVTIMQTALPEAMLSIDKHKIFISELPKTDKFNAVAIGPGIDTHGETENVIKQLLNFNSQPLLFDADAINILSQNKTWLSFLPQGTILTPHIKEFDRLTHQHNDDFERMKTAREFSIKYNCILVLKGAYTQTVMPDGNVFFNSSGNPGLAKAGSGDMLTGIILGLMARGYNPPQAALIGVFVHGLAAELSSKKMSLESILASDVIEKLPKAFLNLYA